MKSIKKYVLIMVIIATAFILTSCDKESGMDAAIAAVTQELDNRGYEHGDTFQLMEKYNDVVITWESTDTVISNDGSVNSIGLTSDVEVKIIVTFVEGEDEIIENYFVTVYYEPDDTTNPVVIPDTDPDQAKIDLVKNYLILDGQVKEDINLIASSNGVTISWASNNTAISNTGVVTRSIAEDISVELVATLTSGDKTDTKTFTIIVLQVDVLGEASEALQIPSNIVNDINFPSAIGDDFVVDITWQSNHPSINVNGTVIASPEEDTNVTLTATLSYDGETIEKTFNVVVLQDNTILDTLESLVLDDIVVRDINLVSSIGLVTITWESSDTNVITTDGIVTRPVTTDVNVTLTATLSYNGYTDEKIFNLIVKPEPTDKIATPVGFVWQGEHNFFAYAAYSSEGYSGIMQATFTTPGEDPIVFVTNSVGSQFSVSAIIEQISNGKEYTIIFVALADGINYADSEPSAPITLTIPVVSLETPTNLLITEGVLTWDEVVDAQSYEIYSQIDGQAKVLLAVVSEDDLLSVTLPTDFGRYQIEVVAKAPLRGDSKGIIDYVVISDTILNLPAPVVTLDNVTNTISWQAIEDAEGYIITVGSTTVTTTATSFELVNITPDIGSYTVTVTAIGDLVFYNDSLESNEIEYNVTKGSEKVDATGLLIQVNIGGGHYSIERPTYVNPIGWDPGKFIVKIYQGDTLVAESTYDTMSNVIHFQYPGEGLLSGLPTGEYIAYFIMVGNGTTHIDSDPIIFTFQYSG